MIPSSIYPDGIKNKGERKKWRGACGPYAHAPSFLPLFLSLVFLPFFLPTEGAMESKAEAKEKAKKEVFEDEKEDEEDGGGAATEDERKKSVSATAASASLKKGGMNHLQAPSCQAEKCAVDLTDAKRYHRRHKVCEQHSKAPVVIVAGLRQRFCQQCSRFHELSEFDEAKRSCRRRLAGHNERRRKNSSESHLEGSSRRAVGPQLKENHCRQADQSGRTQLTLPGSPPYKHFQIR